MAFSTGVSLLTAGKLLLKDQLGGFWEFSGGGFTESISGSVSPNSSYSYGYSITSGVDGTANNAIQFDQGFTANTTSCIFVGAGPKETSFSTATKTYCCFISTASTLLAFNSKEDGFGGYRGVWSVPSADSRSSTASNGYRFYCVSSVYISNTSRRFDFYDSGGNYLNSYTSSGTGATINFGITEYPYHSGTVTAYSKLDKVAVFNGELSPQQIAFLYNSGIGRSYTELSTATV